MNSVPHTLGWAARCHPVCVAAEGMLGNKDYFQGGKVDKDALLSFIRDIKKNTKLSDEDAAIIAASKVHFR